MGGFGHKIKAAILSLLVAAATVGSVLVFLPRDGGFYLSEAVVRSPKGKSAAEGRGLLLRAELLKSAAVRLARRNCATQGSARAGEIYRNLRRSVTAAVRRNGTLRVACAGKDKAESVRFLHAVLEAYEEAAGGPEDDRLRGFVSAAEALNRKQVALSGEVSEKLFELLREKESRLELILELTKTEIAELEKKTAGAGTVPAELQAKLGAKKSYVKSIRSKIAELNRLKKDLAERVKHADALGREYGRLAAALGGNSPDERRLAVGGVATRFVKIPLVARLTALLLGVLVGAVLSMGLFSALLSWGAEASTPQKKPASKAEPAAKRSAVGVRRRSPALRSLRRFVQLRPSPA